MTISDPSSLPKFGKWTHRKGGSYIIIGFAIEEATMTPVVVYQKIGDTSTMWTRPCHEFFDGRFTRA